MKVAELIAVLALQPPDAEVYVSHLDTDPRRAHVTEIGLMLSHTYRTIPGKTYPETQRLHNGDRTPTAIYLAGDVHWADPPPAPLLGNSLKRARQLQAIVGEPRPGAGMPPFQQLTS